MEGLRSCRLGHRQGKTGRMAVTCCWCCCWWWLWMAAAAAAGAGGVGWHGAAQHEWRPRRGQHHPKPSVDAGQDPRAAAALVVRVYQGSCLMAWLRWVVQAAAGAGSGAAAGHGSGDPHRHLHPLTELACRVSKRAPTKRQEPLREERVTSGARGWSCCCFLLSSCRWWLAGDASRPHPTPPDSSVALNDISLWTWR